MSLTHAQQCVCVIIDVQIWGLLYYLNQGQHILISVFLHGSSLISRCLGWFSPAAPVSFHSVIVHIKLLLFISVSPPASSLHLYCCVSQWIHQDFMSMPRTTVHIWNSGKMLPCTNLCLFSRIIITHLWTMKDCQRIMDECFQDATLQQESGASLRRL